jgi:iron complex outermembrane receptor protein
MRPIIFSAVAAVLLLAGSAAAQEAQPRPELAYTLDTTTVTATKREQKVKDIAASVSAASDLDLENIAAKTLQDATALFPNVHMKSTSSGNEIVIRGFSTWDTALQSPAGLYVDGVPYPLSFMQNMDLLDVERIEVLRGPQGTLYGRNSESGVVNLVRRAPDDTARGSVFAEVGSFETLRAGASAAGPLVEDSVYLSGSFLRHQTDGFVENIHKGSDSAAGRKADSGRAMLRLTPTADLDLRLSVDATHSDDGIGTMRLDTGPNRSGRLKVRSDAADDASSDLVVPALVADYATDLVKVTSITSYMDYDYKMKSDIDRTASATGVSDMNIDQRNVTQELRLASTGERDLSWVGGAYLGRTSLRTNMDRLRAMATANTYLHTDSTEDTGALFGQATYALLDSLRLTAGLRAEHTRLDGDQTYETGAGLRRDYGKTTDYTELLPMAALSLDMTDNVTGYLSWSRGYLPGGFNVFSASNEDNFSYDAEYSTNYETGLKTSWLDDRLLANLSVFHSTIRDKQVREEDAAGGVGAWKFTNSAKAHSTGVELEARAYPVAGLELRAGLGYARSEVDEWTVGGADYDGKRLPWAPDLTFNLGVGYTLENGLFAQVDLFGSGKQYFDAENSLSDAGYRTVNLQLGYRMEQWEFSVWAKNLLDDRYATKKLEANGQTIVEDGDPMSFGTRVVWRF